MSKIDIINRILVKLGESPISSVEENPMGKVFYTVYEEMKELLLASYPWRFALKREILAPLEEEPKSIRFKYKFRIPSDCLMIRKVGELNKFPDLGCPNVTSETMYEIMGKDIYFHGDILPLEYVARVDEDMFSINFTEALCNKVAAELSVKLHQNTNLMQLYEQKYLGSVQDAITHNEIQADSESMPENSWLAIRGVWGNGD